MIVDWIIRKQLLKSLAYRGDGAPSLRYFSPEDQGVECEPYSFLSGENRLHGGAYFLGKGPYKGVIVFFHGLGAGHYAYSKEIAYFAKNGFLVYSYDQTGCMMSEGKDMISLAQNTVDMDWFFRFLDTQEKAKGLPRYSCGHSWGGFASLYTLVHPEYEIQKVVSLAGFTSIPTIACEKVKEIAKYRKKLEKAIKRLFGEGAVVDLVPLVAKTEKKVLYIQGDHDEMVNTANAYDVLYAKAKDNPNVTFILRKGWAHQPYLTKRAQEYFDHLILEEKITSPKRDLNLEVDYEKVGEDDPKLMGAILSFLEGN